MSEYRAIVFDLDGTAVGNFSGSMPSQRMIDTINKYRDKIHLVAATGRSIADAMPVIRALGLTNPCIVAGGTIIIDPTTMEVLKRTTLPPKSVQAIVSLLEAYPDLPLYIQEDRLGKGSKAAIGRIYDDADIIYIADVTLEYVEDLSRQLNQIPFVTASQGDSWSGIGQTFCITHSAATKEHAVSTVLKSLGVPSVASIGIGDGNNDLHLFRSVGLKIAMGNGSPDLKAAADLIAPSVDDDGLADIIERYTVARVV
jgi:HAD superfamily hydrolase (TIGR01484 family)